MSRIDHTHEARSSSWVDGADDHPDFPVQNLPLGMFAPPGQGPRIGCAIGDHILDLAPLDADADYGPALREPVLNALFALPAEARLALRHRLFALLTLPAERDRLLPHLHAAASCTLHLPFRIGDYTDFYVGIHHAMNVGAQFRPDNPLLPNYKHIPIGYHGRASSVRVSGAPVIRPKGQLKPADADAPAHGPTRRLDYELELGVWIAGSNELGETVPIAHAGERIGGFCLLNDWSARDIQAWEYQPLGPFLAKNFLTSVSPWVITSEAMAPFHAAQQPRPAGDPQPLAYLSDADDQAHGAVAITLEVAILSAKMREAGRSPHRLSEVGTRWMYWTPAQMIAHHASNGCDLHPGDLLGTGTISGPDRDSLGSLMELSGGGRSPIELPGGETRAFLQDGDEITFRARATKDGFRSIGFGRCTGIVAKQIGP